MVTRSLRVLVVDNDRDAAHVLAELLSALGQHVSYTCDPRLALAMALKCKAEIAFLDLRMPHATGFDVAAAFRAEPALADCLLVAVSAYGNDEYRSASDQAGFAMHLLKPTTPEHLMAAISLAAGAALQSLR